MKKFAALGVILLTGWLLAADSAPTWLVDRFQQFDKNNDGKLTETELGERLFRQLNTNGDDHVTLAESHDVIRRRGLQAVLRGANRDAAPEKPAPNAEAEPLRQGPKRLVAGDHQIGRLVPDLTFTDVNGQVGRLSQKLKGGVLVIAFTNTSCPISKKYAPTLANLEKQFRDKPVSFLFVNPTTSDTLDSIRQAIAAQGFSSSYIRDQEEQFARALGATRTTDVFVLDAKRTLTYRGAVDDQYGFGYSLDAPRHSYLIAAIESTLAGESTKVAATEAPGCPLELSTPAKKSELASVTYHNRISRILQNHCQRCHRSGGVAPFSLGTYDEVVGQAGAIRRAVEQNIMPPWFAATPADGEVSPFSNDCSLAKSDRADLLAWLAGGKPAGDPQDAPLPRSFVDGWQIGRPDAVLSLTKPITIKASGTMPYQNVVIDTGFTEDKYIQAVEVRPTAREVVHHVLVFVIPPARRGEATTEHTEGDDNTDGTDGFFAAYVPGYDALVFHEGYGKVIPAGSRLKFQLHYTPNGTATQDQTQVGLIFAKKRPEHLVGVAGIAQVRLAIPPGADNFEVVATRPVPTEATVLAFFPHMHLRGKAFRYEALLPDGRTQMLLDVPRYDFNWQLSYRLAEPVTLPAGSTIKATAWYDNSRNNPANPDASRTVRWGPQTSDEMMIGYVEYHSEGESLNRARFNIEVLFRQLDKNSDGKLSGSELPTAQKDNLLRLDTNGDGEISLDEAKRLQRLRGR